MLQEPEEPLGLITTGKVLFGLTLWCVPGAPAAATSTLDGAGPRAFRCFCPSLLDPQPMEEEQTLRSYVLRPSTMSGTRK